MPQPSTRTAAVAGRLGELAWAFWRTGGPATASRAASSVSVRRGRTSRASSYRPSDTRRRRAAPPARRAAGPISGRSRTERRTCGAAGAHSRSARRSPPRTRARSIRRRSRSTIVRRPSPHGVGTRPQTLAKTNTREAASRTGLDYYVPRPCRAFWWPRAAGATAPVVPPPGCRSRAKSTEWPTPSSNSAMARPSWLGRAARNAASPRHRAGVASMAWSQAPGTSRRTVRSSRRDEAAGACGVDAWPPSVGRRRAAAVARSPVRRLPPPGWPPPLRAAGHVWHPVDRPPWPPPRSDRTNPGPTAIQLSPRSCRSGGLR